ncbi:SpoIIE family protein phosphatase [Streptomyces sp. BBFR51]|uniref:SpoIIE family protein phosphatase n=1 Tax=Streptomyces sp. BBFR51 TaxID=3372856 RepID=UPI0037DDD4E0
MKALFRRIRHAPHGPKADEGERGRTGGSEPRRPAAGDPGTGHSSGSVLRALLSPRSAAGQVFLLQVGIVVLLVVAAVTALILQAHRDSTREARRQSVTAAEAFANAPGMEEALKSPDPTAVLQPRAEAFRKRGGVDFLTVTDTRGIRYTNPIPERIGKKFVGNIGPSLHGHVLVETLDTPSGHVVQAVVPVTGSDGSVIGLVSSGFKVRSVTSMAANQLPIILGTGAVALVVSTTGTALVARRLRRQTHGLGPVQMARMYDHHDAVLHAVREGVLITGPDGRLILANDEARRLLDLPADVEGRPIGSLGLDEGVERMLASDEPVTDEVRPAGDRLLAVNKRITAPYSGQPGSVATLRDTTELAVVSGRAEVARARLTLLYDAGVRIGTTLDVTRTAEELAEVAVPRFADVAAVDLLEAVPRGQEPSSEAWGRMRRTALCGGAKTSALPPAGKLITVAPGTAPDRALESGRAVAETVPHAAAGPPPWDYQGPEPDRDQGHGPDQDQVRAMPEHGLRSLVTVPLRARGATLGMVHFWRTGDAPAFEEDDLSFAEELAARAAVAVDNARRFTREHAMAVTLQRSLLPRGVPEQNALEAAWRYLPAEAGVGGDWFDVIPLPGSRVALVVGDVVGHGLHAAATMGRLRTAVRNLSALDLPPDELLAYLDDLVIRIDADERTDEEPGEGAGVTGATCLYAVYDSVTGLCTMARAGHPAPVVVRPDGTVDSPQVPVSPPLGLNGIPFETAELRLAEGSKLVLYTDGLIEDRNRDIDSGLALLHGVLHGVADRTPEETCQTVLDTMLPEHPLDDIALLVAGTRLLDPSQVARWDVPSDPRAVAGVRRECARRLEEWGLGETAFTLELILSELLTNAIRYGTEPIGVRLLHDTNLTCEVSDAGSTSPHVRRAATTDEGGRGLFLVAHYAQRWGTRYTPDGKVIWAELAPYADAAGGMADATADTLLAQFDDEL